jgi:hypothetical protein
MLILEAVSDHILSERPLISHKIHLLTEVLVSPMILDILTRPLQILLSRYSLRMMSGSHPFFNVNGRCCQKSMVLVRPVIDDFSNGHPKYFKMWARLLKVYDDLEGIKCTYMAIT